MPLGPLLPVAHGDVDGDIDGEPDQQHRDGYRYLVERRPSPAHDAERPHQHDHHADQPEDDVERIPVSDREQSRHEHERHRPDDREAVLHRLLHLLVDQAKAEDDGSGARAVLGDRLHGDLRGHDVRGIADPV